MMAVAASRATAWRIMVIDDNAEDRAEVRRLLLRGSERRYIFAEAANGATGVAAVLAAGALPDCLLLDYNLPDMDAPTVLAALAGSDGLLVCPVVVLTGGPGPEAGRAVLRAGAQDYIDKAWLTSPALTRAVENAIERLAMARELLGREAALRRSQQELQTLADNTPDILTRFDRNLRYTFVNAAVEKATGRSRLEFLGKTNRELEMPPELCDLWDEAMREVFAKGTQKVLEFAYLSPGGTQHFAAAQLVPEFGADNVVEYVLGVTNDVTERKMYEEALSIADRRKDEFIATLAHELRNPLAPVRTGLQVLRLAPDADVSALTLDMMERQLGQMTRLIDDLLDVSRITSSKVLLRLECVSVHSIAEVAVEVARPLIESGHHALVVDLPKTPLWLNADATRLAQVLGNLLNNSAKYSPGGGRITLAARREGDEAVIEVSDTGLGIPRDMLGKVFEMFTQVNRTLDLAQGGLGIGLALVKRLVDMHHGTVTAESPGAGRGSTITIRLPTVAAPPAAAEPYRPPAEETPPTSRRILVVDDNVDGATTLAMMLDLSGHQTRVAFSGREALEIAAAFRPEVVFLDIGLPGMSGHEVAQHFRADPLLNEAMLVAVTGWGSKDDQRRSKEAGFDVHLTKPVEPAIFDEVIARLSLLLAVRI